MHKCASEQAKAKLIEIIHDLIEAEPFERGGLIWANVHQEPLAAHLGIAVKTLKRWTDELPRVVQFLELGGCSGFPGGEDV